MLIAMLLLSMMDAMGKTLTMAGITAIQILALRSIIIVPVLLAGCAAKGGIEQLKPVKHKAHVARGIAGFVAASCFFLGITDIPLTDAVVILFSSVFFTTLLSIVFLAEKVGIHRWSCILIGFIGVLLVMNPVGGGSLHGYLLVLVGSAAYSVVFVSGRYLSATESVPSLVFSFNAVVGICSIALLPWFWTELSAIRGLQITLLALLALGGHYMVTVAFSRSEASMLAPFEYTSVVWAVLCDVLLWQLYPSQTTLAGTFVIICSGLYIARREHLQKLP